MIEFKCVSCENKYPMDEMGDNGECEFCNSEECPKCCSEAVGYADGIYECFECGNEWNY